MAGNRQFAAARATTPTPPTPAIVEEEPPDPVGTDLGWELRWRTMHTPSEQLVAATVPRFLAALARRHGGIAPAGQQGAEIIVNFERGCHDAFTAALERGETTVPPPGGAPVPPSGTEQAAQARSAPPPKPLTRATGPTPSPQLPSWNAVPPRVGRPVERPAPAQVQIPLALPHDLAHALRVLAAERGLAITAHLRAILTEEVRLQHLWIWDEPRGRSPAALRWAAERGVPDDADAEVAADLEDAPLTARLAALTARAEGKT